MLLLLAIWESKPYHSNLEKFLLGVAGKYALQFDRDISTILTQRVQRQAVFE